MESALPEGWTQEWSSKYNQHYYFHAETGESRWVKPETSTTSNTDDVELAHKRKPAENSEEGSEKRARNAKEEEEEKTGGTGKRKVAILVPYRDLHLEQQREAHLQRFFPFMTRFMQKSADVDFVIFIVEQSNDGRKFNRGKLLNIGFDLAKKEGCASVVFHDVDLLPSDELLPYYCGVPEPKKPCHIARVWNRYNNNPKYFGGIVSFNMADFEEINGFPNNFWGWGGEDDELMKRVQQLRFAPTAPAAGNITDMEEMDLQDKLQFLKAHTEWKCMQKNEVLREHEATWRTNGLSDLHYTVVQTTELNVATKRVLVDLGLNNHWTDARSGVDDATWGK